jgi:hypothetical protein
MLEIGTVKAGDELVEEYGYGHLRRIVKVAKVTPSGQIVLSDNRRYRDNGSAMGDDKWNSSTLHLLTPGLRDEIIREAKRQHNLRILNDTRWENVDDEKLEQIVAILKGEVK